MTYDLFYMASRHDYDEAIEELGRLFPGAEFGDASDDIHEHRFDIRMECALANDEYYTKVLQAGLALCSFSCQLYTMEHPKEAAALIEAYLRRQQGMRGGEPDERPLPFVPESERKL